jgi:hypothetical protein
VGSEHVDSFGERREVTGWLRFPAPQLTQENANHHSTDIVRFLASTEARASPPPSLCTDPINLQTGRVSLTLILTCLPFATLILANTINVAFPDYAADRATGKRTLFVHLGPERAAHWFTALLVIGYAAPWLALGWGNALARLARGNRDTAAGLLSLRELWRGGCRQRERFAINTFLGASAVIAVGVAEVVGFLLTA